MFDVGFDELLIIAIVAIVVIGPKDMPMALRTVGRWIGKFRRVSGHFRAGVENMIREAELEEMEAKWREQNAAIMAAYPTADTEAKAASSVASGDFVAIPTASDPAPAANRAQSGQTADTPAESSEPELPLGPAPR